MVGRMNGPSRHPSGHALLPGALLAALVTAGALLALAVVVGVNRSGPDRLWLGGGDSAISLQGRDDATVIGAARRSTGPRALSLPGGAVALLPGARPVSSGATAVLGAARAAGPIRAGRRLAA